MGIAIDEHALFLRFDDRGFIGENRIEADADIRICAVDGAGFAGTDDDLDNQHRALIGGLNVFDYLAKSLGEILGDGRFVLGEKGQRKDDFVIQSAEHVFFRIKIMIEKTMGASGLVGNGVDRDLVIAKAGKDLNGGFQKLTAAADAQELLDLLILHYKKLGSGAFAKYTAFKYDGEFIGIPHIDSVDFDSLIGIEFQKKTLIDKIEKWKDFGKMKFFYHEFKKAYESSIQGRSNLGDELYNDVVSYMAYKTLKIGLTYADFKRELLPDRIDMYLEKVTEDQSHITYKLRQCMEFVKHSIYERGSGVHEINLVNIHNSNIMSSYREAFELLPPSFYDIDVLFEKETEEILTGLRQGDKFSFTSMSSGERQLMYSLSSILYHVQNLESVEDDACRMSYKLVNLVLDEVELYSHPEYQRTFIADLLDRLSWLQIGYPIKSINILLVTHSPFILSDVPKNNILYLKDGEAVTNTDSFVNTLGANVNDILHQSFFLENGFMGENIQRKIQSLIRFLRSDDIKTFEWDSGRATKFINTLGDEVVVSQLRLLLAKKQMKDKYSYRSWLEQELERLKGEES